ncbi:hypothetical protein PT974_11285 [Cladobotryum mycophilum]|uniref:Uncharacterized protein n=1 Tax=Cladobotryum mycophilum TaxID=491253 RepID=A0ABR0S5Q0_9HYPO
MTSETLNPGVRTGLFIRRIVEKREIKISTTWQESEDRGNYAHVARKFVVASVKPPKWRTRT